MANGDVHDSLSDQYLQQFNRSIGISGMQKLQNFPMLQKLGYNGQLSHLKNDFHGLVDFKSQLAKYSSVSQTLKIAWSLISAIVPNNPNIAKLLFTTPGLGTVGDAFKSIHGFGQVFALSPGDLKSPSTVTSKAAVYKNQSAQASVITQDSTTAQIGGGSGITASSNANQLNGITVAGVPDSTRTELSYNPSTNVLNWVAPGAVPSGPGTIITSGINGGDSFGNFGGALWDGGTSNGAIEPGAIGSPTPYPPNAALNGGSVI